MSDEENQVETEEQKESNVFSLTGDPYEAPETSVEKPCPATLECLKDVMDHAQGNQIRGVYVLGWSPKHQRFVRWCMMPVDEMEDAAAYRFLGGIEVAKADLISIIRGRTIAVDEDGNPIE